ncbi:MAG: hypothetical protein M3Y91_14680 [Actinomycetota bacterium]|nr:hypothetical protein [Actinomycetota bacterium]
MFSEPQVASVGARRQDLEGVDHVVASTPFGDVAYGWALRDDSGFCTIYADPRSGRLLGAHIIGPAAALLLTPLVQALAHGQRAADVARGEIKPGSGPLFQFGAGGAGHGRPPARVCRPPR